MAMKLSCMVCGEFHKADTKRFPFTKYCQKEDAEGKKTVCVEGYICRKCVIKDLRKRQRSKI